MAGRGRTRSDMLAAAAIFILVLFDGGTGAANAQEVAPAPTEADGLVVADAPREAPANDTGSGEFMLDRLVIWSWSHRVRSLPRGTRFMYLACYHEMPPLPNATGEEEPVLSDLRWTSLGPIEDITLGRVETFPAETVVTDSVPAATTSHCSLWVVPIPNGPLPDNATDIHELDSWEDAVLLVVVRARATDEGCEQHTLSRSMRAVAELSVRWRPTWGTYEDSVKCLATSTHFIRLFWFSVLVIMFVIFLCSLRCAYCTYMHSRPPPTYTREDSRARGAPDARAELALRSIGVLLAAARGRPGGMRGGTPVIGLVAVRSRPAPHPSRGRGRGWSGSGDDASDLEGGGGRDEAGWWDKDNGGSGQQSAPTIVVSNPGEAEFTLARVVDDCSHGAGGDAGAEEEEGGSDDGEEGGAGAAGPRRLPGESTEGGGDDLDGSPGPPSSRARRVGRQVEGSCSSGRGGEGSSAGRGQGVTESRVHAFSRPPSVAPSGGGDVVHPSARRAWE